MTVSLEGVTYRPPGAEGPVFANYNAHFPAGQCTAITGPSGSGKTTLLSLASLLVPPESGEIRIGRWQTRQLSNAQRQKLRREEIGMLFQTARVFSKLTVAEHIRFALACGGGRADVPDGKRLLDKLGMEHRITALPAELSGGERTRLAALMALLKKPRVLLADEPTAALDAKNSAMMMELLVGAAQRDGMTVLVVSHDPMVFECSHGLFELSKGA